MTDTEISLAEQLEFQRRKIDELYETIAYHEAFQPEVVAEVAVQLSEDADWDEIAKWCGGTIGNSSDPSGETYSHLVVPGLGTVPQGAWITLDHEGKFRVRFEIEQPPVVPDMATENRRLKLLVDELSEKLAFIAQGSVNATREELVRRITAVGTQEFKRGVWVYLQKRPLQERINELSDELRDLRIPHIRRLWNTIDRLEGHWDECPAPPDAGCTECLLYNHARRQMRELLGTGLPDGAAGTVDPTPPSGGEPG